MSQNSSPLHERVPAGMVSHHAELTTEEQEAHVRSTRRFDLRRIIGAIFVFYGVLVLVVGLADPTADKAKTGGIAINVWTGLAMLVVGGVFFLWDRLRPVPAEDILASYEEEEEERAVGEGRDLG
ncbi:hypothetical protein [Luteimicrobium sp. DT211]|uniref:hypothetical protein n=1 Tax=Luteimicrobium sp. DT211 TaxID=3393412 RepID=UPI003CEEBFEF